MSTNTNTNTTNFALPEGRCGDVDQIEQARQRLRELVEEGLNFGPGRRLMPERAARLKKQACRADTRRRGRVPHGTPGAAMIQP